MTMKTKKCNKKGENWKYILLLEPTQSIVCVTKIGLRKTTASIELN